VWTISFPCFWKDVFSFQKCIAKSVLRKVYCEKCIAKSVLQVLVLLWQTLFSSGWDGTRTLHHFEVHGLLFCGALPIVSTSC
jgi:hypothetical protein